MRRLPFHRRFVAAVILFAATFAMAAPAYAVCTSPDGIAGEIVYNETALTFQYCNDTNWVRMNQLPGSGSGGCTNPAAGEGEMVYNNDAAVLQGCAGNVWRALMPLPGGGTGGGMWTQASTNGDHTCGIKSDGEMYCWGVGYAGVMGDGATTDNHTPTPVSTAGVSGNNWTDVTTAYRNTCGLRDDGTAWCWGEAANGKLGNNTTTGNQSAPVAVVVTGVSGTTWTNIAAIAASSRETTCGLRDDGSIWCWGEGSNGELGNGASVDSSVPVEVDDSALGGTLWTDISGQCGLRDDGHAYCWGRNNRGQVGMNSTAITIHNTPQQVYTATGVSGTSWTSIYSGLDINCGIRDDGTGYCWGWEGYGARGDGVSGNTDNPNIIQTTGVSGANWARLSPGNGITCGVRNDNTGYCWGLNDIGRIGNGTYDNAYTAPQQVAGDWYAFAAGGEFTCGIRENRTITCFGDNNGPFGGDITLGSSTFKLYSASTVPIDDSATSGTGWIDVSANSYATCGVRNDGTGWCWGGEERNNLAYGGGSINTSSRNFSQPQAIDLTGVSGSAWTQMDGGDDGVCGVRDDGTAWCWGWNYNGSMGCGGCANFNYPRPVTTTGVSGSNWTSVTQGESNVCALRDDGTAWCWGEGSNGQIGNGASADVNVPTAVNASGTTGTTWTQISSGGSHVCGVRDDGSAWCWGASTYGIIGDNNASTNPNTPRLVSTAGVSGSAWDHISAGSQTTCGVRDDGSAWCWGYGATGALGNNGTANSPVPVAVSTTGVEGSSWTQIITTNDTSSGNYVFSCGRRNDGTAWCWGDNSVGQLGDGTTTDSLVPVKVMPANGLTGIRWVELDMGNIHTCGRRDSGQIACWGHNGEAEIGLPAFNTTPGVYTDCSNPDRPPGTTLYNTDQNVLQICNSIHWVAAGGVP